MVKRVQLPNQIKTQLHAFFKQDFIARKYDKIPDTKECLVILEFTSIKNEVYCVFDEEFAFKQIL